eukprot:6190965-Pleurochrysis_carterae.AAC.2
MKGGHTAEACRLSEFALHLQCVCAGEEEEGSDLERRRGSREGRAGELGFVRSPTRGRRAPSRLRVLFICPFSDQGKQFLSLQYFVEKRTTLPSSNLAPKTGFQSSTYFCPLGKYS